MFRADNKTQTYTLFTHIEDIAEGMPKSNIDWNIEVLIKIAQITKETIEYKEQTIKETNARKEEILTNVHAEIENLKS